MEAKFGKVEEKTRQSNQALLSAFPLSSLNGIVQSFSLCVNMLGQLILQVGSEQVVSKERIPLNTWTSIGILFDLITFCPKLLLVGNAISVTYAPPSNAIPVIIKNELDDPTEDLAQQPASSQVKSCIPFWPFGQLHVGRYSWPSDEKKLVESDFLDGLLYGAISCLEARIVSSPVEVGKSPSDTSQLTTFQTQLEDSSELFPSNSFPLPSRSSRPLISIEQLRDWKNVLGLYSQLNLSGPPPTPRKKRLPKRENDPRIILCHDYKGGYIKDGSMEAWNHDLSSSAISDSHSKLPSTTLASFPPLIQKRDFKITRVSETVPEVYTFKHWNYIDTFIYFGHSRVTIPPPGWISAAHQHGVEIMGTLIMEWEEGKMQTRELLKGWNGDPNYYIHQLVDICVHFGFDGWFVNIEHDVESNEIPRLIEWLKETKKVFNTKSLKLVWYDSVTREGNLKWQSCLNDHNHCFFECCDYFFIDYHWKPEFLENSILNASCSANGSRIADIYFGIDVHGRGTFGGGGFATPEALQQIRDKSREYSGKESLSAAIFASAWTLESQTDSFEAFERAESKFWEGKQHLNLFDKQFESEIHPLFMQYLPPDLQFSSGSESAENGTSPRSSQVISEISNQVAIASLERFLSNEFDEEAPENSEFVSKIQLASQQFKVLPNSESKFPHIPQIFGPSLLGNQWSFRHIMLDLDKLFLVHWESLAGSQESFATSASPSARAKTCSDWIDSEPEIFISFWYKGTGPNGNDFARIKVLLLNESNQVLNELDTGVIVTSDIWKQYSVKWSQYGKGVRKIVWIDGGRDAEGWFGHYGPIIDRPAIIIPLPFKCDSVSTYVTPRHVDVSSESLPFTTSFDAGEGSDFGLYYQGSKLEGLPSESITTRWYNLSAQSVMPILDVSYDDVDVGTPPSHSPRGMNDRVIRHFKGEIVDSRDVDGGVWHGSSCLKVSAFIHDPCSLQLPKSSPRESNGPPLRLSPRSSVASLPTTSTSTAISCPHEKIERRPSIPRLSSVIRRPSISKMVLSRNVSLHENANISLYELNITATDNRRMIVKVVFRPVSIPPNLVLMLNVHQHQNNPSNQSMAPLSFDLLNQDYRDTYAETNSALGWIQAAIRWDAVPGVVYDGISLSLQYYAPLASEDRIPLSPSAHRLEVSQGASEPLRATSDNTAKSISPPKSHKGESSGNSGVPALDGLFQVLIGFLRVDSESTNLSRYILTSREVEPLNLKYVLSWMPESLESETSIYALTVYWNNPEIPESIRSYGPPHYIVTVTRKEPDESTRILCQGRTWSPSYRVARLPAFGEVAVSVTMVLPDFASYQTPHEKTSILWP